MSKERLKILSNLCLHLILQLVFSRINLFGMLSPVGLAFAFGKLFFDANIFAVTVFYFVSKIYTMINLKWVFVTLYEIVFLALYYFANEFIKTNKKILLAFLFLTLSNVLLFYFSFENLDYVIYFCINLLCEILLFLFFYKFNKTYKSKLVFCKLSRNDYFVFSLMMFLFSLGLFSFEFLFEYASIFLIIFFVIFSVKILPTDRHLVGLVVVMVGLVIATRDFKVFDFVIIFGTILIIFKSFNKWIFLCVSLVLLFVFMNIFKIFNIFSLISGIFAIFLNLIIPRKCINHISSYFDADAHSVIIANFEEQKTESLKLRLLKMSDTLKQMQNGFKFLLVGKIDRNKACNELAGDVISRCCKECENYRFCFFENMNKKMMFENLLVKAVEKGQVSINDLSNGIQTYCNKSHIVANEVNQMARMFLSYESAMKQEDSSKLLISSEIGNFADIFKNFAKTIKNNAKINEKLSKSLKERLINGLINSKEGIIFENENGVERVDLILSNEQALRREVADIVSSSIKNKVQIKEIKHLSSSGFSIVSFIPKSKINIQFSVAAKAKEQVNGDSTVVTKLSENRYFIAIADGMGHGKTASRMSSMILNLIKSLFEVGLDSELVLDSVNRLLIPAGLDNFTTLDACVIDLDLNECVFIKLGSSVSVLKHERTSEIISSDSLPIGIVRNMKPTIVRKQIFQGDMIFLASDGVVDSFSSVQSFQTFINDSKIYNMQKFLDNVIFDAESLNQRHIDDMTIIGVNLLKN